MSRSTHYWRRLPGLLAILAIVFAQLLGTAQLAQAISTTIVISQVYGAGGNAGATYSHDFIELFNRGTTPASLAGWSVQYGSATGTGNIGATSAQLTELPSVTLAPGQYYLIQEFSQAAVGAALPTPDLIDATPINMSGTAGKVALVSVATSLGCNGSSTPCSPAQSAQIIDLVGFGNANFFEGAVAPAPSATTSILRANGGAIDTDNNSTDFTAGTPTPRNSGGATPVAPAITTQPQSQTINSGQAATLSVTASGSVPLAYQWFVGTAGDTASPIGGATSSSYTTPALSATTSYWVRVSNSAGTADSATATITVSVGNLCELTFTPIYAIQGSGTAAAMTGNITTQGVVVGDFETTAGLQGFYIQDPTGDADADTSDGLFVFTGTAANTVNIG
ncbi:MAG: lamin tail domain-containing protein, partial [Roseiflexaceae bacterium]